MEFIVLTFITLISIAIGLPTGLIIVNELQKEKYKNIPVAEIVFVTCMAWYALILIIIGIIELR